MTRHSLIKARTRLVSYHAFFFFFFLDARALDDAYRGLSRNLTSCVRDCLYAATSIRCAMIDSFVLFRYIVLMCTVINSTIARRLRL